jgi:hypothetical protein
MCAKSLSRGGLLEDMMDRPVAMFIARSDITLHMPPGASGNSPCGGE